MSFSNSLEQRPRYAICLMHDALEFLFYEILLANDIDVYSSGRNTIGFDTALLECKKLKISLPLIGTIRQIQKLRGDAKHHGQVPDTEAFKRIVRAFQLIFSVLCFENFGQQLGVELGKGGISQYHLALYDLYRRERGHNWDKALLMGLRALIHKRRAIYKADDDFATHQFGQAEKLVVVLDATKLLSATPEESNIVSSLVAEIQQLLSEGDIRGAAEKVGAGFAELDFVSPTIFDIRRARKLTDRLYQTAQHVLNGMWMMESHEMLTEICKKNPKLVKSFGRPCYMEDEDNYSQWWQFVIFDGARWQPFDLDDSFRISSEPFLDVNDKGSRPANFAGLVCAEFSKAVESGG